MCSSCGCKSAEGVKIDCDECKKEIGTKEEIMEDMVEAHKVERNKTVEILCEGCYHEQPLGSLEEDYNAETTMTVEHKDGSKYRYSETDPIYGEMGEIVGHVSEITDEQDTPYQKIYGRDVTREHNFHLNHAETFEPHRDSKGRFAEKPLLTGSVISGLALGLIYLMRGK